MLWCEDSCAVTQQRASKHGAEYGAGTQADQHPPSIRKHDSPVCFSQTALIAASVSLELANNYKSEEK